jgi:hypothetical protein
MIDKVDTVVSAQSVRPCLKPSGAVVSTVDPRHSDVPTLRGADVAALYYKVRVAGDFYEFPARGRVAGVVRPA